MSSTSPRIERGAALLDTAAPGWEGKIDLNTLDLSSGWYCVVGQVYGDYIDGLAELNGEAEEQPWKYGFESMAAESYDSLTDKWRRFITRRLRRAEAA